MKEKFITSAQFGVTVASKTHTQMILMVFQLKDILDQRLEELEKKLEGVKEDLEKDKKLVCWHFRFISLIKIPFDV